MTGTILEELEIATGTKHYFLRQDIAVRDILLRRKYAIISLFSPRSFSLLSKLFERMDKQNISTENEETLSEMRETT